MKEIMRKLLVLLTVPEIRAGPDLIWTGCGSDKSSEPEPENWVAVRTGTGSGFQQNDFADGPGQNRQTGSRPECRNLLLTRGPGCSSARTSCKCACVFIPCEVQQNRPNSTSTASFSLSQKRFCVIPLVLVLVPVLSCTLQILEEKSITWVY